MPAPQPHCAAGGVTSLPSHPALVCMRARLAAAAATTHRTATAVYTPPRRRPHPPASSHTYPAPPTTHRWVFLVLFPPGFPGAWRAAVGRSPPPICPQAAERCGADAGPPSRVGSCAPRRLWSVFIFLAVVSVVATARVAYGLVFDCGGGHWYLAVPPAGRPLLGGWGERALGASGEGVALSCSSPSALGQHRAIFLPWHPPGLLQLSWTAPLLLVAAGNTFRFDPPFLSLPDTSCRWRWLLRL